MESLYTEFSLFGSKTECARTDDVFSPISEVCDGTVSLAKIFLLGKNIHLRFSNFASEKIKNCCVEKCFFFVIGTHC